jgi:hypothetical protein
MAITKSNKQELSLDHEKPNEKGGCTLATLCTNEVLNLGFSNHNLLTRLLNYLAHERCFSTEQMSK